MNRSRKDRRGGHYRFQIDLVNAAMPTEAWERLRKLRLWHWRQVLMLRAQADGMTTRGLQALAVEYNRQADGHLGVVQALNDFFPIGDNASEEETRTGQELLRAVKERPLD